MGSNIDDYQLQLKSVEQALLTVVNDDDRAALLSLKDNLLELLELTRQTSRLNDNEVVVTSKQGLLAEVNNASADCNGVPDGHTICNNADGGLDLNELQKQLESMVGQKCSAPHKHTWGAVSYHNAIICGIGDSAELCNGGLSAVYMRVLFTNPTHREMLPCSYFLEGDCKFDDTNCHFSHGELVPFSDLREYSEPDFGKLMRNCVVLAKMQDRLWHKGRVLCSNFVEKSCRVRLEDNKHKNKEMEFPFENLFPIFHDEDLSSGSSSDEDTNSDSEELNDLEVARQTCRIEHDLFTFPLSQPLGEWEKHTRGIGSKLMAKMGYIYGTGLGWNGRGIVTPISGQILPQGCSLDHCMQLREAAKGDKDLFSVEKKLNEQKKKLDVLNAKAYEREKQRVDVFSFLNESVLKRNTRDDADSTKKLDKPSLKNQTTKSLNVESVRIADDIRKKTREITRIAESMRRHAVDTNVYKRLKDQMNSATNELNDLKQAESSLAREQATRKTKDKLCIF